MLCVTGVTDVNREDVVVLTLRLALTVKLLPGASAGKCPSDPPSGAD